MTRRPRRRIADLVEVLIDLLDQDDVDPDLEPDADGEPDDNGIADYLSLVMIERKAA